MSRYGLGLLAVSESLDMLGIIGLNNVLINDLCIILCLFFKALHVSS